MVLTFIIKLFFLIFCLWVANLKRVCLYCIQRNVWLYLDCLCNFCWNNTSIVWLNMFKKAECSFYYYFGKIILILQLGIVMTRASWNSCFDTSVTWHNMFQKAEISFCYWFGIIIFILQLGIWTTRAQFYEDTFTIYHDKALTISNDVMIHNSVSLTQCITKCRPNVKCCAASYSNVAMKCQLDISGSCNSEKVSASGWITIIKDNFSK